MEQIVALIGQIFAADRRFEMLGQRPVKAEIADLGNMEIGRRRSPAFLMRYGAANDAIPFDQIVGDQAGQEQVAVLAPGALFAR